MDYAEISVDPKFHRHLIGKGGANSESYVQTFLNQMFLVGIGRVQGLESCGTQPKKNG